MTMKLAIAWQILLLTLAMTTKCMYVCIASVGRWDLKGGGTNAFGYSDSTKFDTLHQQYIRDSVTSLAHNAVV